MIYDIKEKLNAVYNYGLLLDTALAIEQQKQARRANIDDKASAIRHGFSQ